MSEASGVSLIIKGSIFTGGEITQTAVRVENGTIVAISSGDLGRADRVITLGPRESLLPAAVDTLCAMRDWGEAPRETVESVTKAALAGGVTTLCDQCNTLPRINSPELVRKRRDFVAERSYTDFGISGHPPTDATRIDEYRDAGAFSVSLFQWDLQPWNLPRDVDNSRERFRRYAELGLTGLVFVDELAFRETDLWDIGETYALEALLRRLDPDFRVRLFVTLPDSVDRILAVKERLPNVLIQVAPHSLFISRELGYERIGSAAAQTPRLRPAAQVARVREYADQGKIDVFVSHHAAHRTADKYSSDPIPGEFTPKVGYSAIDFAYPLFLTKMGFEQACRCYCENPAAHLGLKKGVIARGYEADLVVVEENSWVPDLGIHESGAITEGVWKVEPANFHSTGKVTPFVGERLRYRVAKTFIRGEEAYDASTETFKRVAVKQVV